MIRCIAIDDEGSSLDLLVDNIRQVPALELVGQCKNAISAMELLKREQVDLLFLDIEMPQIDGLSFLRSLPSRPMVVFITAYRHYAAEGYDLDVLDYLVKPVAFDRFLKAVNKVLDYQRVLRPSLSPAAAPDYLFVPVEYQLTKIFLKDILYAESFRNYVKIWLSGGRQPLFSKMPLKEFQQRLPAGRAFRVHKSYLVMLEKIDAVRHDSVQIGAVSIPVSRSCRDAFFLKIHKDEKK
jgi:DNA-binding LytR/AlgR family response regulator